MKNKTDYPKAHLGNVVFALTRFLKKPNAITHKLGENPVVISSRKALYR
jgi:hypothetical protein